MARRRLDLGVAEQLADRQALAEGEAARCFACGGTPEIKDADALGSVVRKEQSFAGWYAC